MDEALRRRLRAIRHVALDLDGTVYRGGTLLPSTGPFLARVEELGIGRTFLTNNSARSRRDYEEHLRRLGIEGETGVQTSTATALGYLRSRRPEVRRLFVVGTASLIGEVSEHGYDIAADDPQDEPDAVLVGFDPDLGYRALCRAAYWIAAGKPWVATHPDRVCPTDQPTVLIDCGSITRCLEAATGRSPEYVGGKPDPSMLLDVAKREGVAASEMAMAGDRLYTDVAMARRAGALAVLVLTGETTREMAAAADPPPDLVVEDLASFGDLLREARG